MTGPPQVSTHSTARRHSIISQFGSVFDELPPLPCCAAVESLPRLSSPLLHAKTRRRLEAPAVRPPRVLVRNFASILASPPTSRMSGQRLAPVSPKVHQRS